MVALGAACGGEGPGAKAGPPLEFANSDPFGVLDAFGGTDAIERLHAVQNERTRDCMVERGFRFDLAPADTVGLARAARERNLTFGLAPGAATTGNFGLAATEAEYRQAISNPSAAFLATQDPAYRNAWYAAVDGHGGRRESFGERPEISVGIDGCDAHALVEVYGDLATALRIQFLTSVVREDSIAAVFAAPQVTSALARWVRCAADAGHRVANPGEAYRLIEAKAMAADLDDLSGVSRDEHAMYQLFRGCEERSQLHAVAWPLVGAEVEAALLRRSDDVALLKAAITRAGP
ncbi:MAG: hypothetical protein AB1673_09655 [Actinomycetota bacterium]